MTLGRPLTKTDIDTTAANLAGSFSSIADDIVKFLAVTNGYSSADMVSAFGYTQIEADRLKSALADLGAVVAYFQGGVPDVQRDRRTWLRYLLGTNVY